MKRECINLIAAAEDFLAHHRTFRSMPIGAPHSAARMEQDNLIAVENTLRAAITKAKVALT